MKNAGRLRGLCESITFLTAANAVITRVCKSPVEIDERDERTIIASNVMTSMSLNRAVVSY